MKRLLQTVIAAAIALSACSDELTLGTPGIQRISGDGQYGLVGSAAEPLVVRLTGADHGGRPIRVRRLHGSGSPATATITADANGYARLPYVLGATRGLEDVEFTAPGGASVRFLLFASEVPLGKVTGSIVMPRKGGLAPASTLPLPVVGARVWLRYTDMVTATNAAGQFSLPGLPTDLVDLWVEYDGPAGKCYAQVSKQLNAGTTTLPAVACLPPVLWSGAVGRAADGGPLTGAAVVVPYTSFVTATTPGGKWAMPVSPGRELAPWAYSPGFLPAAVALGSLKTGLYQTKLTTPVPVSGRIVLHGAADSSGIVVRLGARAVTTAADGTYRFAAVEPGLYNLRAYHPKLAYRPGGIPSVLVRPGTLALNLPVVYLLAGPVSELDTEDPARLLEAWSVQVVSPNRLGFAAPGSLIAVRVKAQARVSVLIGDTPVVTAAGPDALGNRVYVGEVPAGFDDGWLPVAVHAEAGQGDARLVSDDQTSVRVRRNLPPVAPTVFLPKARTGTPLTALLLTPGADPEGETPTYVYEWQRNGAPVSLAEAALPGTLVADGDVYDVAVRAFDGESFSEPARARRRAGNFAPVVSGAVIPAGVYTRLTGVRAYVTAWNDPDGDPITFVYRWFADGQRLEGAEGSALSGTRVVRGNQVWAEVRGFDGEAFGPPVTTAAVTIVNSPPTPPGVRFQPSRPVQGRALRVWEFAKSADADGDPVTLRYRWTHDGLWYDAPDTTAVLPGGLFVEGDFWRVVVTPDDGYALGPTSAVEGVVAPPGAVPPGCYSVFPAAATAGDVVQLSGADFGAVPARVAVGGYDGEVVTWSDAEVLFRVPPTVPPGQYALTVVAGGIAGNALPFTVAPSMQRWPPSGKAGDRLVVEGANFGTAGTLRLGETVIPTAVWSPTRLEAPVLDVWPAGRYDLVVSAGGVASAPVPWILAPSVTASAAVTADALVTIAAANLGSLQGESRLYLDGSSLAVRSWQNTAVSYSLAEGLAGGTHELWALVGGVESRRVPFVVDPVVASAAPQTRIGAGSVTVMGAGFGVNPAGVSLGGTALSASSWSPRRIDLTVPASVSPGVHDLVVTVGGRSAAPVTVAVLPRIDRNYPDRPVTDSSVTLTGTNFGTAEPVVTLGGIVMQVTYWSTTQLSFPIPASFAEGSHALVVVAGGVSSSPFNLRVYGHKPYYSGLSASSGSVGESFRIFGERFTGLQKVTLGTIAVSATLIDDGTIEVAITDGLAPGMYPVSVETNDGMWPPFDDWQWTQQHCPSMAWCDESVLRFKVLPTLWSATGGVVPQGASQVFEATLSTAQLSYPACTTTCAVQSDSLVDRIFIRTAAADVAAQNIVWRGFNTTFQVPATVPAGAYKIGMVYHGLPSAITSAPELRVTPHIDAATPSIAESPDVVTLSGGNMPATVTPQQLLVNGAEAWWVAYAHNGVIDLNLSPASLGGPGNITLLPSGDTVPFTVRPKITQAGLTTYGGSTNLSIKGSGFVAYRAGGATQVLVSGIAVQPLAISNQSILIPSAALALENATVKVIVDGVASSTVSLSAFSPYLVSRYPHAGTGGTEITLAGTGFGVVPGRVQLGAKDLVLTGWSDTAISAIVPFDAAKGTQDLRVRSSADVTSGTLPFTVRGSDVWVVDDRPVWSASSVTAWTGTELIVVSTGGAARYNPQRDQWSKLVVPSVGTVYGGVWTGGELYVFGLSSAYRYAPATDTWASLNAPVSRPGMTYLYTGTEILAVGGSGGGATLYRVALGTGAFTAVSGWSESVTSAAVVVAAGKLWVWGGIGHASALHSYTPGGAVAIVNGAGTPPRTYGSAATWYNGELVVVGGLPVPGQTAWTWPLYRYRIADNTWYPGVIQNVWPASTVRMVRGLGTTQWVLPNQGADLWSLSLTTLQVGNKYSVPVAQRTANPIVAPAGRELLVWGGAGPWGASSTGARFNFGTYSWRLMAETLDLGCHSNPVSVWTGSELAVWGSCLPGTDAPTGLLYDPVTVSWRPMSTTGAPTESSASGAWNGTALNVVVGGQYLYSYSPATNAWAGTQPQAPQIVEGPIRAAGGKLVVCGGTAPTPSDKGIVYDSALRTWSALPNVYTGPRYGHVMEFDGSYLFVWGGRFSTAANSDLAYGARLRLSTGVWDATSAAPISARSYAWSVWTGSKYLILGGYQGTSPQLVGGSYDPAARTWQTISVPFSSFQGRAGFWTGSKFVFTGSNLGGVTSLGKTFIPATGWQAATNSAPPISMAGSTSQPAYGLTMTWTGESGLLFLGDRIYEYVP